MYLAAVARSNSVSVISDEFTNTDACILLGELWNHGHMADNIFGGVHHIAIICSDYEKSKRFYVDVLKSEIVTEIYREERKSFKLNLRLVDGVEIELFSFPESPARPSYPEACGLRHLALKVGDFVAAINWMTSNNVFVEDVRVDELTGARFTFLADPDGLPIELYEHLV